MITFVGGSKFAKGGSKSDSEYGLPGVHIRVPALRPWNTMVPQYEHCYVISACDMHVPSCVGTFYEGACRWRWSLSRLEEGVTSVMYSRYRFRVVTVFGLNKKNQITLPLFDSAFI